MKNFDLVIVYRDISGSHSLMFGCEARNFQTVTEYANELAETIERMGKSITQISVSLA